jgi:hypothetical protein
VALLAEHLERAAVLITARLRALPVGDLAGAVAELVAVTAAHNTDGAQLMAVLHQYAPRSPQLRAQLAEVRGVAAAELTAHAVAAQRAPAENGRLRLRADLTARLIEHLIHATVLDPPRDTAPAESRAKSPRSRSLPHRTHPPPRALTWTRAASGRPTEAGRARRRAQGAVLPCSHPGAWTRHQDVPAGPQLAGFIGRKLGAASALELASKR